MFVNDRMTRTPFTVHEEQTVRQAAELLAREKIHQLPVVRGDNRLVGIVTDRDVRNVVGQDRDVWTVERIMTANPITVSPGEPLEEALLLLHRHRFGALPVVTPPPSGQLDADGLPRLVGIITTTDILAALIDMLGIAEPGTRFEVELPAASAGQICGAMEAVARGGAKVISMVLSDVPGARRRRLYLRLSTIDPRPTIDALAESGCKIVDPYCPLV